VGRADRPVPGTRPAAGHRRSALPRRDCRGDRQHGRRPLETQINGIDNLLYFNSTSSSSGNASISIIFRPGSDPDINQVNVQNRVSQALPTLPQVVTQQGVTVEKKSSSLMMVVSVYSPDERYDATYIDNYTNLYVLEELKRIPGANRASVFGLPDIAMRVWLRPDRLAQLGISTQDVASAIQSQNQTFGVGQIGAEPSPKGTQQTFVVTAQGLLSKPRSSRTSSSARPSKAPRSCACGTSAASSWPSAITPWRAA